MIFEMLCGYLVLAAIFYYRLALKATDVVVPAFSPRHKWQRARRIKSGNPLRRIRPLMVLRFAKRSH